MDFKSHLNWNRARQSFQVWALRCLSAALRQQKLNCKDLHLPPTSRTNQSSLAALAMKGRFSTPRSARITPGPQGVLRGVFHGSVQGISLPMSAQPTHGPREDELYGPQCELLAPLSQGKNQTLLENQTLNCSLTAEKEKSTADRRKDSILKSLKSDAVTAVKQVPGRLVLWPLLW